MDIVSLLSWLLAVVHLIGGQDSTIADDPWLKLQISPQVVASMPYMDFRVNVYSGVGNQDRPRYFFAPISVLDPSSATSAVNNATDEIEASFRVNLWNEDVEQEVANYLTSVLGTEVSSSQVQVIPFDKVILSSTIPTKRYSLTHEWVPYQSQQSLVFKINCYSLDTCSKLAEQMRTQPEHFSHFKLQFGVESQQDQQREALIRVGDMQSSSLFEELNQRFPHSDEVLLTFVLWKELFAEMVTNTIMLTFSDQEVVAQQGRSYVFALMGNYLLLGFETISTGCSVRWNLAFWDKETNRPDRVTKTLNEVYRISPREAQLKLETILSSPADNLQQLQAGFESFGFTTGFTTNTTNTDEKAKESFFRMILESRKFLQWDGVQFVPKPVTFIRLNLGLLRNSKAQQEVQATVFYSTAVLSTAVSFPSSYQSVLAGGVLNAEARLAVPTSGTNNNGAEYLTSAITELWKQVAQLNSTHVEIKNQYGKLQTSIQGLEPMIPDIAALVKRSKTPVYFSAYRTTPMIWPVRSVITYSGTWINMGQAMNVTSGNFTAPYRGIYFFSFNTHYINGASILLQVNNVFRCSTAHYNDRFTSSGFTQTLELMKGDTVRVVIFGGNTADRVAVPQAGGPVDVHNTHFIGFLLHNME